MSLLDHVDKLHNDGEAELRMLQGEPISSKEEEEDGNCEIEEEISTSTMRTTRIISHSNNEINNYDGEANEEEENEETAFRYLAEIKRTHEEGEKKLFALKGLRQNMLLQKDQSDQQELLEKQSQELFAMQDLLNIIKGIPATAAAAMEERRINNSTDSMIEKQQGASATTQLDFADDEESQLDLINSAILSIQRDFAGGQDSEIQTQASETVQKLIHLAKQEEEMAALKHQIKSLEDDLESKRVFMLGRIQEEKDALESFEKQPNNNAEKLDKDKIAVEEDEDEQEEIASLMEQFTKLEQGLEALEKRQKMLSLLSGEELDDTVEDAAAKESELKMEEKEEGHDEIVATVGQLSNESQVAVNSMESKEKTATTKETASDLLALMGRLSAASLTTDLNPIKPENVPKSIYADTIEQLEQEYEHSVNEGSRRNNLEAMDQLEKLKPLAEEGAEKLEMDEDNDEEEGEVEEDLEETAQDFSSALASTEETLSKIDVNIDVSVLNNSSILKIITLLGWFPQRVLANLEELEFWQPINDKDKKDVDTLRNCLRNQLFELQEVRVD